MPMLKYSMPICALLAVAALAACQTTSMPAGPAAAPVSTEQATAALPGNWVGYLTNGTGKHFSAAMDLGARDGAITGTADIPESDYDKHPTLNGTYTGNQVLIKTSAGFTYDLLLSDVGNGGYLLKGRMSGPIAGRMEFHRQ